MANCSKWKTLEYSRTQISRAGELIKKGQLSETDLVTSEQIIDNWRASHAFPMHIIYMHLRRLCQKRPDAIVAERLKRLESIKNKLRREPTMNLWSMQDLGGCRVIVPTINEVYHLSKTYEDSRKRHILTSSNDYIRNPKRSGYRSLHKIYKYHSDNNNTYNRNMLIEIQFRTHLQHIWATAIETMGLFSNQSLKSGEGSEESRRFFALVSSLFAISEHQNIVPETSGDVDKLIFEIKELDKKHHFLDFLQGISGAAKSYVNIKKHALSKAKAPYYYILILDHKTQRLTIDCFMPSEIDEATKKYNSIEQLKSEKNIDAVLVSVSSFNVLKKAYPNYFLDIKKFVETVRKHILQ